MDRFLEVQEVVTTQREHYGKLQNLHYKTNNKSPDSFILFNISDFFFANLKKNTNPYNVKH